MAKKRGGTATSTKPSKKAGRKAAKTTEQSAPKPSQAPVVTESEQALKDRLALMATHGVVMGSVTYQKLSNEKLRIVNRWADTIRDTHGESIPPLPTCLLDYATRACCWQSSPSSRAAATARNRLSRIQGTSR